MLETVIPKRMERMGLGKLLRLQERLRKTRTPSKVWGPSERDAFFRWETVSFHGCLERLLRPQTFEGVRVFRSLSCKRKSLPSPILSIFFGMTVSNIRNFQRRLGMSTDNVMKQQNRKQNFEENIFPHAWVLH